MPKPHIGSLPPRYTFLLNPHPDVRLSKCTKCKKPAKPRKFPLFIVVDDWGPVVVDKTCQYCTACEIIMCNQDDLDDALTRIFSRLMPAVIGNVYRVIGPVGLRAWSGVEEGTSLPMEQYLAYLTDFKKVMELDYDPGGLRRSDDKTDRAVLHADAEARRKTSWTMSREPESP